MDNGSAELNLGTCLVVKDLGTNILIGQPAKEEHHIITYPHLRQVTFKDVDGFSHAKLYLDLKGHQLKWLEMRRSSAYIRVKHTSIESLVIFLRSG